MPKYEICIVRKEYRYIKIDAATESDAKNLAWDKVASGDAHDIKPPDYDTEIFIDSLIEENEDA